MFIKIDNVNYFVLVEDKTIGQIYSEILGRMAKSFISEKEKRKIINQIESQMITNKVVA